MSKTTQEPMSFQVALAAWNAAKKECDDAYRDMVYANQREHAVDFTQQEVQDHESFGRFDVRVIDYPKVRAYYVIYKPKSYAPLVFPVACYSTDGSDRPGEMESKARRLAQALNATLGIVR